MGAQPIRSGRLDISNQITGLGEINICLEQLVPMSIRIPCLSGGCYKPRHRAARTSPSSHPHRQ